MIIIFLSASLFQAENSTRISVEAPDSDQLVEIQLESRSKPATYIYTPFYCAHA